MTISQRGRLRISFGAMAESIATQVFACGLEIDHRQSKALQSQADALVALRVSGILTESECHKANIRLMKRIVAAVTSTKP